MYGFGDAAQPLPESLALVESLVQQYVVGMSEKAAEIASLRGRLDAECFIYAVKNDKEKYQRVQELLKAHEEIKEAKRNNVTDEENLFEADRSLSARGAGGGGGKRRRRGDDDDDG